MKKQINTLFIISISLSFLLLISVISLNINESNSVNLEDNTLNNIEQVDNKVTSFSVADFANKEENTIDIVSKKYYDNTISISDTNFTISSELTSKIMSTINSYGVASSFYIISLDDGMSIGYNVDRQYETASSIKAPYALYIYEEIDAGNIDSDKKIKYQSYHYNKGTGIIKNSKFGTEYTVRDLLYYSLNDSDNIAHIMLHKEFGVKGYNSMLKNLGTKQLYLTYSNPWAYTSCRSAAIIWQEIYNFSIRSEEGINLLNILSNGKYNYYKEVMPSIPSASKTGFANKDVVETGIVFDNHPYIAIAMANKGGNIGAYSQVIKLIGYMNDVMLEYNDYLNTTIK